MNPRAIHVGTYLLGPAGQVRLVIAINGPRTRAQYVQISQGRCTAKPALAVGSRRWVNLETIAKWGVEIDLEKKFLEGQLSA